LGSPVEVGSLKPGTGQQDYHLILESYVQFNLYHPESDVVDQYSTEPAILVDHPTLNDLLMEAPLKRCIGCASFLER
jgi:hypothetical protein